MLNTWRGARLLSALLVASVLIVAACSSTTSSSSTSTSSGSPSNVSSSVAAPLGTLHAATGSPVKVGFMTSGSGQGFDLTVEEPVAKATAQWINDYHGGLAGHPIQLDVCENQQDPGKAADCANRLIQDGVVAVVYGSDPIFEASWKPLSAAGIPTFIYVTTTTTASMEPKNTFIFQNARGTTIGTPLALAKKRGDKVVSVIAVDLPAATNAFRTGPGPREFKDAGIKLDLIPVPIGTPDMTVQTQQLVKKNPDGVVSILGNDAFCIAAINGLKAAGFTGVITANESCITKNTIQAVGAGAVKGVRIYALVPYNEKNNPSTKLLNAILAKYAPKVDPSAEDVVFAFLGMTGFGTATAQLKGAVTPQSVTAAAKSMPWTEQPGTGGRHIRCNGKADPTQPAVCSNALLLATLDASGKPATYEVLDDEKIPD